MKLCRRFESGLPHNNTGQRAIPQSLRELLLSIFVICRMSDGASGNNTEVHMSNEEKRQQVADGLERRKADRARREAILEDQARQLRLTISGNHAAKTRADIQKNLDAASNRRCKADRAERHAQARNTLPASWYHHREASWFCQQGQCEQKRNTAACRKYQW